VFIGCGFSAIFVIAYKVCRNLAVTVPDETDQVEASERLSKEEGDALRNLLHYLRYTMRHQYVAIAQKIGVRPEALWLVTSGRSRGTQALKDRLYKYAQDRRIPIEVATDLGAGHGFRSELNISDETLTKDSARVAGRYLNLTLLTGAPSERIGVTLVTLYRKEEGDSLPEFSTWRPERDGASAVRHKGFYYFFHGALYLVGHTVSTGFPRLTCLQPQDSEGTGPYFGTVTAASNEDVAFHSWCFLHRTTTPLIRMRKQNWSTLGIFEMQALADSEPDAVRMLRGRTVQRLSRPITSHG
jgi:hypothetical protein